MCQKKKKRLARECLNFIISKCQRIYIIFKIINQKSLRIYGIYPLSLKKKDSHEINRLQKQIAVKQICKFTNPKRKNIQINNDRFFSNNFYDYFQFTLERILYRTRFLVEETVESRKISMYLAGKR